MKSGIQISSLKPLLQTNEQVQTALENCRGLGCRWVQLQWIHPSVAPEFIARALEMSVCGPFPFRIFTKL